MRHISDYPLWLGHAGDARDRNELFRLGIALTWPLILVGLGIFLVLLLRK